MGDYPNDELEFQRLWSSNAGSVAALAACIVEVEKRAADAFVRSRDDVANALRDLATVLKSRHNKGSEELQAFINENHRRIHERTKMLRH